MREEFENVLPMVLISTESSSGQRFVWCGGVCELWLPFPIDLHVILITCDVLLTLQNHHLLCLWLLLRLLNNCSCGFPFPVNRFWNYPCFYALSSRSLTVASCFLKQALFPQGQILLPARWGDIPFIHSSRLCSRGVIVSFSVSFGMLSQEPLYILESRCCVSSTTSLSFLSFCPVRNLNHNCNSL